MFEILHFRGSEEILKEKGLLKDVQATMQYIDDVLTGALYKRELLRMAWMKWTGALTVMPCESSRAGATCIKALSVESPSMEIFLPTNTSWKDWSACRSDMTNSVSMPVSCW
jgi:hypothetical protein